MVYASLDWYLGSWTDFVDLWQFDGSLPEPGMEVPPHLTGDHSTPVDDLNIPQANAKMANTRF